MKPVQTAPRDRKDAREMMVRWALPVLPEPMEQRERLERRELMEQRELQEQREPQDQRELQVPERLFRLRQDYQFP